MLGPDVQSVPPAVLQSHGVAGVVRLHHARQRDAAHCRRHLRAAVPGGAGVNAEGSHSWHGCTHVRNHGCADSLDLEARVVIVSCCAAPLPLCIVSTGVFRLRALVGAFLEVSCRLLGPVTQLQRLLVRRQALSRWRLSTLLTGR